MGFAMTGTTIRWFGPSWGAPMCQPQFRVPEPLDCECIACGKGFERSNQGVRLPHLSEPGHVGFSHFHLGCFLVSLGVLDEDMLARTNAGITVFSHTDLHGGQPSDIGDTQADATPITRQPHIADNSETTSIESEASCASDADSHVSFSDSLGCADRQDDGVRDRR